MKGTPWDDPFNDPPPDRVVKILWDYSTELVVGEGHVPTLFDTFWTYTYRPSLQLAWTLCRVPGETLYMQEAAVPEMVRLAAMVTE